MSKINEEGKLNQTIKKFGTYTSDLKQFAYWLKANNCEMVAMESTGVYWKGPYNILEAEEIPAMIVNACHVKTVPGRKTDVNDAKWLSKLLLAGLLNPSFIPHRVQRELRELVRYRRSLVEEIAREKNRLQKVLESGNVKLASVLTDINGVASRRILERLLEQKNLSKEEVQELLIGEKMREKIDEIMLSLENTLSSLQVELLTTQLEQIDELAKSLKKVDKLVAKYTQEWGPQIANLTELPGIGELSAREILVEIGIDMDQFPSAAHLTSWASLSPGSNESAGKKKSSKTKKGNKHLKSIMVRCATSAIKNVNSRFYKQYVNLRQRKNHQKAIVAVARKMLVIIYHMLQDGTKYEEPNVTEAEQKQKDDQTKKSINRLEKQGYTITKPATTAR